MTDKDGKETTINKRLFQSNFDEKGNVIKAVDFIASKLKDGSATALDKELIESNFQSAYRDHAELNRGGLALGSDFQEKFIKEINTKLKGSAPNLDLAIVPIKTTIKNRYPAIQVPQLMLIICVMAQKSRR